MNHRLHIQMLDRNHVKIVLSTSEQQLFLDKMVLTYGVFPNSPIGPKFS